MRNPLKRSWEGKVIPITLGILSCLVILGFYPDFFERWVVDPPLRVLGAVMGGIGQTFRSTTLVWGRYVAIVDARQQNVRLKKEVEDLHRSLSTFHAMEAQRESLMALLGLKKRLAQKDIACHVIADNPTTAPRTLLLDCGSQQGVRVRDGVVGDRGVVGFVVRVFSSFCQVLWIEDSMFALEGRLSESGQNGLVRGMGAGHRLKLKYVGARMTAEMGGTVTTTGEDGFFPPDEPIGRVVQSENRKHHIFRTIRLESVERLDSLWAVFVLSPPYNWTSSALMGRKAL